ncbi:hypothetical protein [Cupriavidus metallidurans]|uniref:hypothetical protein n=1 Tax=Cupriavidus metallidurans TaxID=119219 RepID=UPI001CCC746E|nr:hypothetical protein [Cupriavidus metallidurans]UBM12748.1 hypothetical protein LAI70_28455 [Cupriavidus metallidurans]
MTDFVNMQNIQPGKDSSLVSLYESATGRITSQGLLQNSVIADMTARGELSVNGWYDGALNYVKAGAVTQRPANTAVLAGKTLSKLPSPCTIVIDETRYACTGTTATLDLTMPKTYQIRVEAFPMQDATFQIIVP